MKKFLFSIVFLVIFSSVSALDFQRDDWQSTLKTGLRKNQVGSTLFFPETILWHGLFQNYLHRWIDRPLFHDRETRYPQSFRYITEASLMRDFDIIKSYEFDGLGFFCNGVRYQKFKDAIEIFDRYARAKHQVFMQYAGGDRGELENDPDFIKALEIAKDSPSVFRIDGKILVPSYRLEHGNRKIAAEMLKDARERVGDIFLVLGRGGGSIADFDRIQKYLKSGIIPKTELELMERQIEESLDVFDGLQTSVGDKKRDYMGDYMFMDDGSLFLKYRLPMLEKIYRKDKYRNKLLGVVIQAGYVNHHTGETDGEFGTSTFRNSFERAMLLNPDYILFFEWNEANENTSFQPTVSNSDAMKRILRYYFREVRKQEQTPLEGDNTTIPNLILSARETVKAGEPLQFELLNVPDGSPGEIYGVQLKLYDNNGKMIQVFPTEKFDPRKMRAVTYTVPSEQLAMHQAVLPEITIDNGRTFSMNYVRIRPTTCYVYKSIRQPLRSMFTPDNVNLTVRKQENGKFRIDAALKAAEALAFLEITDNEREVYAVDPRNEFDRENSALVMLTFSSKPGGRGKFPFALTVKNSKNWKMFPSHPYNDSFGVDLSRKDNHYTGEVFLWGGTHRLFLTVPKNDVDKAVLSVKLAESENSWNLGELSRMGKCAAILRTPGSTRLDIEIIDKTPDIPHHINQSEAAIHTEISSAYRIPVYQLRGITKSGKIYRSKPVIPVEIKPGAITTNLFSEATRQVVSAKLPTAELPVIDFLFDPAYGAMLPSRFEPFFDAQLGGGFIYGEAFNVFDMPKNRVFAPQWLKENGRDILRFDGVAQYINLSREALPRGSFTLEFEIRPQDSGKPQVLFRHYDFYMGSITVYLKNNRLILFFPDETWKTYTLTPDFPVPYGQWADIKISYDCKNLTININGQAETYSLTAKAWNFKTAIFGGHTRKQWGVNEDMSFFKGDLRKLMIKHYCEK